LVKFYYGPIENDPDVTVSIPGMSRSDVYLRVRINMVVGVMDQMKLGSQTMDKLSGSLSGSSFYEPMPGKAVHVCGNPANSYYAGYLVQEDGASEYEADFRAMAAAIAGVPEGVEFRVDEHKYTYMVDNVTDTTAEMWATRTA
jgi:hypothetical protein